MRKIIVVGLAVAWLGLGSALAQQGDPALNMCQQLLGRANAEIIQMSTQATMLSRQLEEAKKSTAPPPPPPPAEPKP